MKLDTSADFEKVYAQYSEPIYRFIYWQTKNPDLADDLTSLVFERAWASRASFKGGSLQAWLYRIARNCIIDYWRKHKDLLLDDVAGASESIAGNALIYDFDEEQLQHQLARALNQLSQRHHTALYRRINGATSS